MGLLDALKDRQFWSDVADNTAQLGKAASDAVASNVTGPVDMAAWALRKAGLPIPAAPVGGSDWAKSMGLLNGPQPTQSAQIAGETLGLLAPTMIAGKAPQIAKGLLSLDDKAMDMGRIAIENHMVKNGMIQPATVWHGSPHKFDKFDSSKIGTGEGNQAYGHGLYFAENPGVAQSYQINLTAGNDPRDFINNIASVLGKNKKTAPQDVATELRRYEQTAPLADNPDLVSLTKRMADGYEWNPHGGETWTSDAMNAMKRLDAALPKTPEGSLYKVDLPDEHIAKMLDWDKPLSQQAPEVQSIFGKSEKITGAQALKAIEANPEQYFSQTMNGRDLTGAMIRPERGSSEFLKQKGIPGIRYLDGGSRGAGAGTSNFVVFPGNEGLLQILERNGKKIGE